MKYRLGLDLGTNSLGAWMLALDHGGNLVSSKGGAARIFSDGRDPKTGASLAEDRRLARAMRRRRDRYLRRRSVLLSEMIDAGLMPTDVAGRKALELLDPYVLRVKALDEPLNPAEIGRALFHLNQRRGFKSNRKTDRKDTEKGKIAAGMDALHAAMSERNARTYGEFLAMRQAEGETVRARLQADPDGPGTEYDFYPDRTEMEAEFHAIWDAQAAHHPGLLTDTLKARLFEVIFFQRPLKTPEVGRCLYLDEKRLPKRHPLFQQRRLYETVNQLRIAKTGAVERPLTLDERDKLILLLHDKKKVAFKTLRGKLKLDDDERFTLESERRKDLEGDEVRAALLGTKPKPVYPSGWGALSWERQAEVVEKLHETEDEAELLDWLRTELKVDDETAAKIAGAALPEGYGRIGLTATLEILEALKADVISYDKAVIAAPSLDHHSDFRNKEEGVDELPYYGEVLDRHILPGTNDEADADPDRWGRLTNPTVHIGLGQLRRTVNAIIAEHGPPAEIVVELARDLKMNDRQRQENDKRLNQTTKAAQERSKKLIELGIDDTGANRLRLRLWEELHPDPKSRCCVYTGEAIGPSRLFSNAVEIDHILPYSKTLDDSPANRMLIMREANRRKRNRDPHTAFGDTPEWTEIAERASHLPKNQRWRFAADAMEKFEADGGFIARQLTDTQYLSRLAKQYLEVVSPGKVWVVPGRLTEMLRRHWGLNSILPDHNFAHTGKSKNRLDHRHHAIDAAVIAATDRALLNRISREAGQRESQELDEVVARVPPPWPTFRDDLREQVRALVVSHKPDHGRPTKDGAARGRDTTTARLHNDTAYGFTGETDEKGKELVVRRVALMALTDKQIANIRDDLLREALWEATRDKTGKDREKALRTFGAKHPQYDGIRRVRVTEPLSVIPVRDATGRAYKGYKGDSNHRYEVWELPDGKWVADVTSTFDANSAGGESSVKREYPTARKVMRLHQNDLVAFEKDGERVIARVVKFGQNGQVTLASHNEAGDLKRRDSSHIDEDPFKYFGPTAGGLKKAQARKVRVTESGKVYDPGPPKA